MIKYINISGNEYNKLSNEEKKKAYCIEYDFMRDWKVNRKYHREDGPAEEYNDGKKYWWLNDKSYTFEEWYKKLNKSDEEIIFLKLKYNIMA